MTTAPRLMAITDCQQWPMSAVEARIAVLCSLAEPGSVVVQLRDRELPVRERLTLGERLLAVVRATGQRLIVNDRLDLVVLLGADGVHLPEQGVAPEAARDLLTQKGLKDPWISCAWHAPAHPLSAAATAGVLSPILSERKGRVPLGLAALQMARASLQGGQLLYALGGVGAANAAQCLRAGAHGIAAIGAVLEEEPAPLLRALGCVRGG
jgi:thiamine-phosphate diphosphorylase